VKHSLCRFEDIEDGASRGFELDLKGSKTQLFVVRKGTDVFGYINECPHIGTPLNWKNTLRDARRSLPGRRRPLHGWSMSRPKLKTG
jgi:nitrite reductase/ring-hydroxylating ferredoxin subunit